MVMENELILPAKIPIKTGMRGVFKAPPGYNVVVSDYSS